MLLLRRRRREEGGSFSSCVLLLLAIISAVQAGGEKETPSDTIVTETTIIDTSNTTTDTNATTVTDTDTYNATAVPTTTPVSILVSNTTCESLHYDCNQCLANGCYWCTYDSLCFTTPEFVSEQSPNHDALFPNKLHSCRTPEDFTTTTCTAPNNFFSDPMYGGQNWIFEQIKVVPVWQKGYSGKGVRVRINDEGMELTHPEFLNRIDINASCALDNSDGMGGLSPPITNAVEGTSTAKHGMVVASIVGATGNNEQCGVGIAPEVTFSSCSSSTAFSGAPALLTYKLEQMDISQNSWAFEGCGLLSTLDPNRKNRNRRKMKNRHRQRQQRTLQTAEDVSTITTENATTTTTEDDILAAAVAAVNATTTTTTTTTTGTTSNNQTATVVAPFVTECPFVYKPFDTYALSPCDLCTIFSHQTAIENDLESQLLGEECISAITKHCDFYYVKERNACVEYLDLILEDKYPSTQGECRFKTLTTAAREAFTKGVTEGRDGKGIIYVFAAGNENRVGDDTNFQGYGSNTRFTIPVASTGKSGNYSSFSTSGASVFISGPGGDPRQAHTTVIAAVNNGKCADAGDGTSFAAPLISGVVALMLEANPVLGWRDVQDILARSAQVRNDGEDPTFAINSARIGHSNRYGFGIVDAEAAVNMSETWTNLGPEKMLVGEGAGEVPIFDHHPDSNSTTVNVTMTSAGVPFITENVYLYLKLNHTSRGHLRITLTSPGGMLSVLTPGFRPEDQTDEWMKFTTVRHWGENPNGEWTISIYDTLQGDVNNCSDTSSEWQWELNDDFSNNNTVYEEEVVTCDDDSEQFLRLFCIDGQIDRNDSYYGQLCTGGSEEACALLEEFASATYNGVKVADECCLCGGGEPPSLLPDHLFEWKVAVYGHQNFNNSLAEDMASDGKDLGIATNTADGTEEAANGTDSDGKVMGTLESNDKAAEDAAKEEDSAATVITTMGSIVAVAAAVVTVFGM